MSDLLLCELPGTRCRVRVVSKADVVLQMLRPHPHASEMSLLAKTKAKPACSQTCAYFRGKPCKIITHVEALRRTQSGFQRGDGRTYSCLSLPPRPPLQPGTPSSPSSLSSPSAAFKALYQKL